MTSGVNTVLLEVCVDSVQSGLKASLNGANRLELCSQLDLDGLSPNLDDVDKLCQELQSVQCTQDGSGCNLEVPTKTTVHIMVRPRSGDFFYSSEEVDEMVNQIHCLRKIQSKYPKVLKGVVFGVLQRYKRPNITHSIGDDISNGVEGDKEIVVVNKEETMKLLKAAKPHFSVTFHRAFDYLSDLESSLRDLMQLYDESTPTVSSTSNLKANPSVDTPVSHAKVNIDRVLTSGGGGTSGKAIDNVQKLKKLVEIANGKLIIMPGGGIRKHNFKKIIKETGSQEIHSSVYFSTS